MAVLLGIETSCDDTAAAVLDGGTIRSNVVSSQDEVHGAFGGIVPELASREHVRNILPIIHTALHRGGIDISEVDAVAVTCGPGLVGSLLVGLSVAKGIAVACAAPLVGVNHLEGHLLSVLLDQDVRFPFLGLLVSGGHTSLYLAEGLGKYALVGRTRDDAAGEAFDKTAKLLGLGYPGGRIIDSLARDGDPCAINFPRSVVKRSAYDFSFSGLKTAVWQYLAGVQTQPATDVAASVQEAIVDMLVDTTCAAAVHLGVRRVVVAGGVSANTRLRERFGEEGARLGIEVAFPRLALCTDNAAMIAYAGWRRFLQGADDGLEVAAQASLALEPGWNG